MTLDISGILWNGCGGGIRENTNSIGLMEGEAWVSRAGEVQCRDIFGDLRRGSRDGGNGISESGYDDERDVR